MYHRSFLFFFFNDTATTEIYTLSLHDALPILASVLRVVGLRAGGLVRRSRRGRRRNLDLASLNNRPWRDRKSTRLNSSHANISYAVFCLKKKKHISTCCILHVRSDALRCHH